MFEVENKFQLESVDTIQAKLAELGCQFLPSVVQRDQYYNHPQRDFAKTDEALRIRSVGQENWITYKGPKIDTATKTRQEIEPLLAPGSDNAEQMAAVLVSLGFRPVRVVEKSRRTAQLLWQETQVEVALDEIEGLGSFLELEIIADEAQLDAARDSLTSLATHLSLAQPERRSYLEMLLASD
jgi:adenylate cyclase class 2